jgi:hypothetical protein
MGNKLSCVLLGKRHGKRNSSLPWRAAGAVYLLALQGWQPSEVPPASALGVRLARYLQAGPMKIYQQTEITTDDWRALCNERCLFYKPKGWIWTDTMAIRCRT